jgi:hypothetical protein
MSKDLLKEAIADAKAVRETAIANAKIALQEAFTPKIKSMLAAQISEEEEEEMEMDSDEVSADSVDTISDEPISDELMMNFLMMNFLMMNFLMMNFLMMMKKI